MRPVAVALAGFAAYAGGASLAQITPEGETDLARAMRMTARYGPGYLALAPTHKLGNGWCLAPWSGNSQPYERARREIEASFGQPRDFDSTAIRRLRDAAKASPGSALAQFRWVLATNRQASKVSEAGKSVGRIDFDEAGRMRWALALAPDPHVAEYARLRFAMEASQLSPDEARALSRRLRDRWPDDRSIRFSTARMLINSRVAPDFDEATRIADALMATDPNRASYVALKCDVCMRAWFRLHRRQDGLAAIEWHDRYARRFSEESTDRDALARIMDRIKGQLNGKIPLSKG